MASADGGKWEGVRNLIHKFDFAKEMQASLQTEMEVDATSMETSETQKPRILKTRSSDEKEVHKRNTKRSDKRRGVMFQEFPELNKFEGLQNDLGSPKQIATQRKMLSVCSVDLSVSRKQETTKNKLIVICKNAIEQNKRDRDVKSSDAKKDLLPKQPREQKEDFELEKLEDDLKEVTRLVLHMESEMREAKEKLTRLSQLLDDKKTEQQRNRNKQLQKKKDEHVMEMLSKETQTVNSDNSLEEVFDAQQNSTVTQPNQETVDNTQKCRQNRAPDEIDSEELNGREDHTVFAAETHVTETRKKDGDVMNNETLDNRLLRKHVDEKTIIIPNEIKAEDRYLTKVNEKESFEKEHSTKSDKTVNTGLGKDRQVNDNHEVVVDKIQLNNAHLEATITGTDKQTDGHDASSLKLALKETNKEAVKDATKLLRKNHKREDAESAAHDEDQHTSENKFDENTTKTRSHESNLDSKKHETEQCTDKNVLSLDETEVMNELTEKSDTVHYQFGTTNQVNQYIDFSGAITRELGLQNKRKSVYAKGWNVDIRQDVYSAENKLHEINFSTEQTRSSERMNQEIKKNLDEATNEQRLGKDKIQSVKPCDDASIAIWGVAKIDDELFLLRDSSQASELWLVKEDSFEYLWKLRGRPLDMAGDSRNRYLYIIRCIEPDNEIMISVHDINESKRPSEIPKHIWTVYTGRYVTLSITAESNILLTMMESRMLVEYTYNREVEKVLREIKISNLANPLHAVKQSRNTYVVCHGENRDEKHRVCIVNVSGHILKDICLRTYSDVRVSVVPMYLALGKGGSIIVAENRRGQVVQLNADLTVGNVLMTINDGLRGPCRLHFDEISGQIIVADNEHGWRDGKLLFRDV